MIRKQTHCKKAFKKLIIFHYFPNIFQKNKTTQKTIQIPHKKMQQNSNNSLNSSLPNKVLSPSKRKIHNDNKRNNSKLKWTTLTGTLEEVKNRLVGPGG